MSGITEREMEFIELCEKSYLKQKRNAFIEGVLIGIMGGIFLSLLIITIF